MKQLKINNPFHAPVYHEEITCSTMEISRSLALQGAVHGTVFASDFQETGRGRIQGRLWEAGKGESLLFTILLRYPGLDKIPRAFTLRAGLAVALAIEDFEPSLKNISAIKWPNDVMLIDRSKGRQNAKKTAGILAEAENGNVYLGIGVNVAQKKFSFNLQNKAGSISLAAGKEFAAHERFVLLELILKRLHKEFSLTACANSQIWKKRIEERLFKKGEKVCFAEGPANSKTIISGILTGLGPEGELQILPHDEKEIRTFITGELIF